MATRINTAQRNKSLDDGVLFDGGTATGYTGAQPAAAGDAASGTQLFQITMPTPAFGAAVSGVRSKAGTWSATAGATGTAGYVRLVSASGDRRMDLLVGAEVTMDSTSVVNGGSVEV